jgi:phosphoribosylanthranilate isomerase
MTTRAKICGITRLEDALHAASSGADYLGYIFYAPSKRFVAPRTAKEIIQKVRTDFPAVQHVGVFVDETPENMVWVRNLAALDLLQLHGNETPAVCEELGALGIDVVKTLAIGEEETSTDFRQYDVSFFLCDTHDPKLKGGTGRTFDLNRVPSGLPHEKMFIAGGLTPENVVELIREQAPYAVDVSTGVEESPGIKSHRRITEFIESVLRGNGSAVQEKQA